jgi:hypothetical protein
MVLLRFIHYLVIVIVIVIGFFIFYISDVTFETSGDEYEQVSI